VHLAGANTAAGLAAQWREAAGSALPRRLRSKETLGFGGGRTNRFFVSSDVHAWPSDAHGQTRCRRGLRGSGDWARLAARPSVAGLKAQPRANQAAGLKEPTGRATAAGLSRASWAPTVPVRAARAKRAVLRLCWAERAPSEPRAGRAHTGAVQIAGPHEEESI
jgi:hypothetical protein